jgi:hypothetical protein
MFRDTDITRMPCFWRQYVTVFTEELPWLTLGKTHLTIGTNGAIVWRYAPKSATSPARLRAQELIQRSGLGDGAILATREVWR